MNIKSILVLLAAVLVYACASRSEFYNQLIGQDLNMVMENWDPPRLVVKKSSNNYAHIFVEVLSREPDYRAQVREVGQLTWTFTCFYTDRNGVITKWDALKTNVALDSSQIVDYFFYSKDPLEKHMEVKN
ncbi:MAG: hypothetical protein ACPGTP_08960 [Bacteroidia bacterium]